MNIIPSQSLTLVNILILLDLQRLVMVRACELKHIINQFLGDAVILDVHEANRFSLKVLSFLQQI
jgi:hypothetical protein